MRCCLLSICGEFLHPVVFITVVVNTECYRKIIKIGVKDIFPVKLRVHPAVQNVLRCALSRSYILTVVVKPILYYLAINSVETLTAVSFVGEVCCDFITTDLCGFVSILIPLDGCNAVLRSVFVYQSEYFCLFCGAVDRLICYVR